MSDLKAQFEQAQKDVKTLGAKPDNNTLLALYSLFKQATEGDVSGKRPGVLNQVARAKFDAWANIKGKSADDSMSDYIALVQKLLKG